MTEVLVRAGYDVVVIGGGAAGLSAALALSRARRTVLVIDDGTPRNATAGHVHNYLGREGTTPADLLAAGRIEVTGYGGEVIHGTVRSARPGDGGNLRVKLADGSAIDARRLLVTTGLLDELPDVPGLAGRWGRDVLHCPYCHGWEVRDQALGVLSTGPMAVHQALLFRQWSSEVTFFQHTAPAPNEEELEQLTARGIPVVSGQVTAVEVADDRLTGIRMSSGTVVPVQAVVVAPIFTARADVLAALRLQPTEMLVGDYVMGTYIAGDPNGATAVPRVWVAGNVADFRAQVISSAAAGLTTAAAINADLVAEDTARAVAELRAGPAGVVDSAAQEFWDGHYGQRERVWSGKPNPVLVDVVGQLPPGTALDLGCGEGGDAIWLAQSGWQVTAVDISATALDRAAAIAATAGVGDRIDWQQHDLARTVPHGAFDLVSAQFLQSPVEFPREQVLRGAARAVAPGGLLLIVGHADFPPWAEHDHSDLRLPTAAEVWADLDLDPEHWDTERLESATRPATGPDGQTAILTDTVVAVRRREVLPPR